VTNFATANASDRKRYASFFHAMLERGVYLAPSQLEAGFTSAAHGAPQIAAFERAAAGAMANMK
jgi:glutamate-1-semialdehyde 2,1-aminomutase